MRGFLCESPIKQTTYFFGILGGFGLITSLVALRVFEQNVAISVALGTGFTLFSFTTLGLALLLVFFKKNIALLIGVIVLKWPLMIYLALRIVKVVEVDAVGFVAGSLIWFPASLLIYFLYNRD